MSRKLLTLSLESLLLLVACNPSATERLGLLQQNIVNGELSGVEDNAIVKLESADDTGAIHNCTATLVAPNLIITALHCVSNNNALPYTCDANGDLAAGPGGQIGTLNLASKISVKSGSTPTTKAVAKGLEIFAAQTTTVCHNDIALVLLDRVLDQPPASLPISSIRLFNGVEPGASVRIVGYGQGSDDGDSGTVPRHSRSGLIVARVGSSEFRPVGDGIPPRTFTTNGPGGCPMDSGGPALSDNNAVVGVFSQFVGDCASPTTVNYFTEVAPFRGDVILGAFTAAGYEPWLEGNMEPGLYGTGGNVGAGGETSTGGADNATAGGAGGASSSTGADTSGGATLAATTSSGGTSGATAVNNASGGADAGSPGSAAAMGGTLSASGGAPPDIGGSSHEVTIFDRGPSPGGSCACRFNPSRNYGLGFLGLVVAGLGARRRRSRDASWGTLRNSRNVIRLESEQPWSDIHPRITLEPHARPRPRFATRRQRNPVHRVLEHRPTT